MFYNPPLTVAPILLRFSAFWGTPLEVAPILLRFSAFWGAAPIWNCAWLTTLSRQFVIRHVLYYKKMNRRNHWKEIISCYCVLFIVSLWVLLLLIRQFISRIWVLCSRCSVISQFLLQARTKQQERKQRDSKKHFFKKFNILLIFY